MPTTEPTKKPKTRSDAHQAAALAIKLTTIDGRIATARQTITDGENAKAALLGNASPTVRAMAEAIRGASNGSADAPKGAGRKAE